MDSHGPPCVRPFCVTAGRLRFFCTQPQRAPRFVEVATLKLRLLYTQFDLAEGFCPAFEFPGQPFVADPGLPPKVGAAPPGGGVATGLPEATQAEECLRSTTPKAKPGPPGESKLEPVGSPVAGAAPFLGEVEEEKKERKERRSAPRGHRDPRSETSQKSRGEVKEDPYTASAKRRRSESADRHGRKRSRKTRSRTRRRSRTRSRHRSRQRRREEFPEASREKRSPKFEEVKKESPSSERKPKSGRASARACPATLPR